MRQTLADGTAGYGHDRRQSAQGSGAGRRVADHIEADVTEKVQRRRRRWRRLRRKRFRRSGRLVLGQGRQERTPARLQRTVDRRVARLATAPTAERHVPCVRTQRLPRSSSLRSVGTRPIRPCYRLHDIPPARRRRPKRARIRQTTHLTVGLELEECIDRKCFIYIFFITRIDQLRMSYIGFWINLRRHF